MGRRLYWAVILSVAAALAMAGCGAGAPGPAPNEVMETAPPTQESPLTAPDSPVATPMPEARTIEVSARNFEFEPDEFHVGVGETVRFVVRSVEGYHTFTVKESKGSTEMLINLELFSGVDPVEVTYTFDSPGDYYLYCIPHEGLGMVGKIEVE